ncbi:MULTISPECIES: hypothetical protein [Sutcliffiella]|uniref:Uncharacterized protein n=1 Tax=Sutcliffiella cohnii TaxID=33932 RepID=A0A223KNH0_9BACI|nr:MULTISPECIES: hypothetical protein [Sutcliffiella]AST91032.1 hypothetical protein BC6307_06935 [Sutcliffiella cohnii]WBL16830.1 hypothetical protein O1A01_09415 [Sutcliffiella sp. NC1]
MNKMCENHETLLQELAYKLLTIDTTVRKPLSLEEKTLTYFLNHAKEEDKSIDVLPLLKGKKLSGGESNQLVNVIINVLSIVQLYNRIDISSLYVKHKSYPSPRSLYPTEIFIVDSQNVIGQDTNKVYHLNSNTVTLDPLETLLTVLHQHNDHYYLTLYLNYDFYKLQPFYNFLRESLCYLELGHFLTNLQIMSDVIGMKIEVKNSPYGIQVGLMAGGNTIENVMENNLLISQWRELFYKRNSGSGLSGIVPLQVKLSKEAFLQLLQSTQTMKECNLFTEFSVREAMKHIMLHFTVQHVNGLKKGCYQYDLLNDRLIRQGISKEEEGALYSYTGTINFTHMPLICTFSIDFEQLEKRYGKHYFRYSQLVVGMISQFLLLKAAKLGLFARPYKSYFQYEADQQLNTLNGTRTSQYKIMFGLQADTIFQSITF